MAALRCLVLVVLLTSLTACGASEEDSAETSPTAPSEAAAPEAPPIYEAHGVVQSVTPSGSYVQIHHDDIPGFMDSMTMPFAVPDSLPIDGIARGDSIAFTFVAGRESTTI